jgi:hypothetical protein
MGSPAPYARAPLSDGWRTRSLANYPSLLRLYYVWEEPTPAFGFVCTDIVGGQPSCQVPSLLCLLPIEEREGRKGESQAEREVSKR